MKSIVIVGAGVCGCTTYLFLKKYLSPLFPDLNIQIYESFPPPRYLSRQFSAPTNNAASSTDPGAKQNPKSDSANDVTTALGGGLGLSPNGIRVLESLDPEICKQIKKAGIEVDHFGIQLSSGRKLGSFNVGGERYGHGTLLIMRATLHDAVLERVNRKDITFEKKVKSVLDGDEKVRIEFEDGESVDADLVIGADGVWGRTREAIPECREVKAEYDGLVGIGAFFDEQTTRNMISKLKSQKGLVIPDTRMTMTFGPGAFFGIVIDKKALDVNPSEDRSSTSKDLDRDLPCAGWWSTFPMEPPPTSRTPFSEVKAEVLAKHENWNPLIPALIESSDFDGSGKGTLVLPRWITPSLPKWTSKSGRVLLVGDAAHCMPPDSGQGVSCAVEDAMTVGLLCKAIMEPGSPSNKQEGKEVREKEQLKTLCNLYTQVRKPRCEFIVAEARKRGNMKRELSWWEEAVRNVSLYVFCKIMPKSANDAFFSWDVETEVNKALRGEVPAVVGKGKVNGINTA